MTGRDVLPSLPFGVAALVVFVVIVLIIDRHRRTGRKLTIDGTNQPVLDDPSSFGYIVSHTDGPDGWA